MRNFQLIAHSVDVTHLQNALVRQPELWNQNTYRTTYEGTPHKDVDDIWLRYPKEAGEAAAEDLAPVQNAGSDWYPAADKLREARKLILDLMSYIGAYQLDRVLISRIPPGGRVLPHADKYGDYVQLDDIARYHLVIQGLPGSQYRCGGEEVDMLTGEVWWFNPLKIHEVVNNSADDRIHLMVDLRRYP